MFLVVIIFFFRDDLPGVLFPLRETVLVDHFEEEHGSILCSSFLFYSFDSFILPFCGGFKANFESGSFGRFLFSVLPSTVGL